MQEVVVYQGATVELVDPIDFFIGPEKRELYDEYPIMIRSRHSLEWFKSKNYFVNLEKLNLDEDTPDILSKEQRDLLDERRGVLLESKDSVQRKGQLEYVEWFGRGDLDSTGQHWWLVGAIEGKLIARMENIDEVYALGHPPIVVGVIDK
jgi:hypothetical protein